MNMFFPRFILSILIFFIFFSELLYAGTPPPVSGRPLNEKSILPADVLARSKLLISELQLIRLELGKPDLLFQSTKVVNAAPREVYFQALALFNKANRLSFENTGFLEPKPKIMASGAIRPYHVWKMVDHALQRILEVKKALHIPEKSQELLLSIDTTPSDVFASMLNANRVINALLNRRFSPSDVYQRVTVSVYTMAQLLATFPKVKRIPSEPKFERYKDPSDVYIRLLECYRLLGEIGKLSGSEFLEFSRSEETLTNKEPSDVYDLASLLVADISYLHVSRKKSKKSAKAYYPGFKIPSDVYQRVGLLYKQLELLKIAVKKEPKWLGK